MANNNATDMICRIKTILAQYDENSAKTLEKIKQALNEEQCPDFLTINDGDHFFYHGIRFLRLGEEQGGILCMTSQVWKEAAFDENGYNDWRKSSARKLLNSKFLDLLNIDDLLPYTLDLTADNGDTTYGECADYIGLLSCDLYRKYRKIVPLFDEWMWTCTPWHCGTPNSGFAGSVCHVGPGDTLNVYTVSSSIGLAPVCIFKKEIFQQ